MLELPVAAARCAKYQPSSFSIRSISLTFMKLAYQGPGSYAGPYGLAA